MKDLTFSTLISTMLLSVVLCVPAMAQEAQEEADWVVVTYYKCDFGAIDELNEVAHTELGPVAEERIDEGQLIAWGVLNHGWGDSWNFNVYWIVEDIEEFMPFWYDFMGTVEERSPGWLEPIQEHCHDHKDNIYRRVHARDAAGS